MISREAQFAEDVLNEFGPMSEFVPVAYYEQDGDCIEFRFSV